MTSRRRLIRISNPVRAMGDRPPFDAIRAGFLLVAVVIVVHCAVVLAGAAVCLVRLEDYAKIGAECDQGNKLAGLLAAALSAALAFAGLGRGKP